MSTLLPEISILSAVHNEDSYIREMISSVQAQSLQSWELLFVDDGSTDGTASIIEESARTDKRIRLISRDIRLGKVEAFNLAQRHSTGAVIVLLAGDDRLPRDSLRIRFEALAKQPENSPSVGFFKIKTFSTERRFDGIIIPRSEAGSRSGGSITMNRALANEIFPIDSSLISEDIWLGHAAADLATTLINGTEVVLEYRIHAGNSNPRSRSFEMMTEAIHTRHRAYRALLDSDRLPLSAAARSELHSLWTGELLRYSGATFSIIKLRLPITDRLALMSGSSRTLFEIRSRFYRLFSGRRGR